jgi:predicted O-methyltransferase YrrM
VFTGYSSLWVALNLPDDGKLIACDIDPVSTSIAQRYWKVAYLIGTHSQIFISKFEIMLSFSVFEYLIVKEAGVSHKVELRLGDALETLDKLIESGQQNSFDFAFIDADKQNMINYYEKCLILVRVGGLIAIDNVLWVSCRN